MTKGFKRYCKTLELENDPSLIEEYKELHAMGRAWPEITQGMKEVGIIDMEIYLSGTTLFMIMDTEEDFDHERDLNILSGLPGQSEWEALVSKFQKTSASTSAREKWKLVERIFKLDQDVECNVEEGYVERMKIKQKPNNSK
ncbi:MAG: L-rhamnose mutarotase [Candidatus Kryptoniota bacterium]